MSSTDLDPATDPALAPARPPGPADGASAGRVPGRRGPRSGAPVAARSPRWWAGLAGQVGLVAATTLIVLDGAAAKSPLIPRSPKIAGYLSGLGSRLDFKTFLYALLVMSACYAAVLWSRRTVSIRAAAIVVVILHAVVLAGPVLLSQDIFQYIDYGRLGVFHGLNPFTHGPAVAPHDPVYKFVGRVWHHTPSAYGPLFTLLMYPIAALGVVGALWSLKVLAVAASLVTVYLVWLCARRLGRDGVTAVLLVGCNPLLVIYGVGGFHNDLLMDALMMGGVWLTLRDRDGLGAGAIVAGAAVKATSAAVLPFMLLGRRRLSLVSGTVLALAVLAVISFLAFGVHGLDFVSVLRRNQSFVSNDSFPNEIAHTLGYPGVYPVDRSLLRLGTVLVVLWLMWRTWRGYDWISGAAWALLIVAVSTTWLLAWYLLWALPLAAIARDRRVLWATLGVSALFIVHQTAPLFSR